MGTKHYGATFNQAHRKLLAAEPSLPIRVRTVPAGSLPKDDDEECGHGRTDAYLDPRTKRVRYVVVSVARGQDEVMATDTLIHEWAHAVDILRNGWNHREPHRDSWGKLHSRAYRVVNG